MGITTNPQKSWSGPPPTPESLQKTIPLPYRILLLYYEPFFAIIGTLLCLFHPALFLSGMQPFPASSWYHPDSQIIFSQLAATYFLFAFNEVFVLRATSELKVWKMVVLGILLCDIIHLYASFQALGWVVAVRPWLWRPEDAFNLAMLYGPGMMRAAFLMEVGFESSQVKRRD